MRGSSRVESANLEGSSDRWMLKDYIFILLGHPFAGLYLCLPKSSERALKEIHALG